MLMALSDKVSDKSNRKDKVLTKLEKVSRRTRRDLKTALSEELIDKIIRRLRKK